MQPTAPLITLDEYFGPYWAGEYCTPQLQDDARRLLLAVNPALELAITEGVPVMPNPKTGTYVSGEGHGGFRGPDFHGGALHSKHRAALAVDVYDPLHHLAAWSLRNQDRLRQLGIRCMEAPRFTPTWVHWQVVDVGSGSWAFVPSRDAVALADPLPGELA